MKHHESHAKHREIHRIRLLPLLEVDEDGVPVAELQCWPHRRWSSDEDDPEIDSGDLPVDFPPGDPQREE